LIGIPYHLGVPVVSSRFGTDLESLNYAIQSHLESHDVLGMFELEMNQLRKWYIQASADDAKKCIAKPMSKYFDIPQDTVFSNQQILKILNKEQRFIEEGSRYASNLPDLVLDLAKRHATPRIEIFPNQLFTNSYITRFYSKKSKG
jgi:hypothetical protein